MFNIYIHQEMFEDQTPGFAIERLHTWYQEPILYVLIAISDVSVGDPSGVHFWQSHPDPPHPLP